MRIVLEAVFVWASTWFRIVCALRKLHLQPYYGIRFRIIGSGKY